MRQLGRSETRFDPNALVKFFSGKTVLITGAAGSIGAALCEELADLGCAKLAMLDHFDHGLLEISERVARQNPSLKIVDALCDVRDRERLKIWMDRVHPDVVIHAAALKHVHLGERHPAECLLTNLIGVRNVLAAADAVGAEHFMLISSDKAASPVCAMGATKRLAELHLAAFHRENPNSRMQVKSVRFGNVMGSQGSVAPRFMQQIAAGGPIEITHTGMRRFFMSTQEAVGLILTVTAFEDSEARYAGAYFMDMGEPISILQLGKDMIEQSGRKIEIRVTGLRPGEKLSEALSDEHETVLDCGLPGIFRIEPLSTAAFCSSAEVEQLEALAGIHDEAVIRGRIFAHLDARLQRDERAAG